MASESEEKLLGVPFVLEKRSLEDQIMEICGRVGLLVTRLEVLEKEAAENPLPDYIQDRLASLEKFHLGYAHRFERALEDLKRAEKFTAEWQAELIKLHDRMTGNVEVVEPLQVEGVEK